MVRTNNHPMDCRSGFWTTCARQTGRRSRIVIEHILKHGYISTEDLSEEYGYGHPPRAARDVREQGIPLETFYVTGSDGRRIAAYRFGDPHDARPYKLGGRGIWPKDSSLSRPDRDVPSAPRPTGLASFRSTTGCLTRSGAIGVTVMWTRPRSCSSAAHATASSHGPASTATTLPGHGMRRCVGPAIGQPGRLQSQFAQADDASGSGLNPEI